MIEVPQELSNFKSSLEGKTGNMKSASSNMQSKISSLSSTTNTVQNGIDESYQSENKPTLLNSFGSINTSLTQIGSSLGEMNAILARVDNLIDKIVQLEELCETINKLESNLSSKKSEPEKDSSEISRLEGEISEKKATFENDKNEALSELDSLKSEDISLDVSIASGGSASTTTINVTGGHIEQGIFTYGKYKIPYYIYVPDVEGSTEKIPVHMYLHGSGEMGSGLLKRGLPKQLVDGTINLPAITICPQTGREEYYRDSEYQDALVALTNSVVDDYNGDKNRISISGHSAGANECYRLVKRYPDQFSAMVPVSCGDYISTKEIESFRNTKIWALHGDKDTHPGLATYSSDVQKTIKPLEDAGIDIDFTTIVGQGHDLQDTIADLKYVNKDGTEINPIVWAIMQAKG